MLKRSKGKEKFITAPIESAPGQETVRQRARPAPAPAAPASTAASALPWAPPPAHARVRSKFSQELAKKLLPSDADDVIDLGAPRTKRRERTRAAPPRPRAYVPNPRLYPGRPRPKARANAAGHTRRPVPNSRLYRPPPPHPPPPAATPRAAWSPPPPRSLDTASHVALRVGAARAGRPPPQSAAAALASPSRRLVVTLPAAAAGADSPTRLRPRAMEASAEDGSDGNDPPSAPSEVLAEFLSAIMQRQYAEALTYCRLILQYEPHNATARGFYPLLQHKLRARRPTGSDRADSSEEASVRSDRSDEPARVDSPMEQAADSEDSEQGDERSGAGGSVASQSSLELDSEPSLELSRRTDSGSGCWESSGSASRSDADDNGNAPPPLAARGDENDNAADAATATAAGAGAGAGEDEPHTARRLKSESVASLRRLRAQFACSIK